MKRGIVVAAAMLWAANLRVNAAPAPAPADFAYGMAVTTAGDASAYRFTLPLDVYRTAVRRDLGDVRVFNAQAQMVPFALRRDAPPTAALVWQVPPLFPLRPRTSVIIDGVRVSVERSGSTLNVESQQSGDARVMLKATQYIIDARVLSTAVAALRLEWPANAAEYSGRMRVETSEDLGSWLTVVDAAPIANLHAAGSQLIENVIHLPNTRSKFLRLTWVAEPPPFELAFVAAGLSDAPAQPALLTLEVTGESGEAAGELQFDLRAHVPVERVDVLLPDVNSVAQVELASRDDLKAPWRTLQRAGFYRLRNATGEQRSAPLEISINSDRYWRLRVVAPAGAVLAGDTRLQVEWAPLDLEFLAQGPGPFLLAFGSAVVKPAFADLNLLPAGIDLALATLESSSPLGGAAKLLAPIPPPNHKPLILWSVLLVGVGLLGWMAWRLSNE